MSGNIIDDIDALIDAQLDEGEPIGGFDFGDPDYPECPHCGADWHGLAITERMRRMRFRGVVDDDYRYSEDDSRVICPGSEFIGPMPAPQAPRGSYDDGGPLRPGRRRIPRPSARWWRCENPNPEMEWILSPEYSIDHDRHGLSIAETHRLTRATLALRRIGTLDVVSVIVLQIDPESANYARHEHTPTGSLSAVEIFAETPPPPETGDWRDREGRPPAPYSVGGEVHDLPDGTTEMTMHDPAVDASSSLGPWVDALTSLRDAFDRVTRPR